MASSVKGNGKKKRGRPKGIHKPLFWIKDSVKALTDKTILDVANHIRMGCPMDSAAQAVGISKETLHNWLRSGNDANRKQEIETLSDEDKLYLKFLEAVNQAAAAADVRDLKNIDRAGGRGDWKANAWKLSRRSPMVYGFRGEMVHKGVIAHEHAHTHYLSLDDLNLSFEVRKALLDAIRAKKAEILAKQDPHLLEHKEIQDG